MRKSFWKPRKIVGGLVGPLVLLAVFPAPASAYPRPGTTDRVSVGSGGAEGNKSSPDPAVSADGRHVAFSSLASNLVPGDTNETTDIFVRDRVGGTTERVSVATGGAEANHQTLSPSISADGRHVAFRSLASNLVPGDTNDAPDIFVRDRVAGTTERVSVATGGAEANGFSYEPEISADGRHIAYISDASNLVPGDQNGARDVFVHDRETGATERVSVTSDGAEANDRTTLPPAIDADGRHVAFASFASNLVPGDTNDVPDVFVRDREAGTTERISVATGGAEANDGSIAPVITADGRHVAFPSPASNLVPGDTNGQGLAGQDVFVHDRETGTTERISVSSDGAEGGGLSTLPSVSADGRHVAFASFASNLVPGDTNDTFLDVFVHDREAGTTERLSVSPDGAEGDNTSFVPAISAGGRHVAFGSYASNLVPADTNGTWDVFVRDRGPVAGVGALEVQKAPGELTVSGWATLSGAAVSSADDPSDDGGPDAGEVGAELTGASVVYNPEQEGLLVRLHVASLPGARCAIAVCERGGGAAGVVAPGTLHQRVLYRLAFEQEGTSWEVRARSGSSLETPAGTESDPPHFALYRCDPACTEHAPLAGGIGTTGAEVRLSVPLSALGASEGTALTQVRASTSREEGALEDEETMDEADLPDVLIPVPRVELGIAPPSAPQAEVSFSTQADLVEGRFSGTLDTSSLPLGEYRVWARACLAEICEAHSVQVAL